MRRLKDQDAVHVDTNAKYLFTFVMNVRAYLLFTCSLTRGCGAVIWRTITSPFQQLPTWGPCRAYHVTCQRRWKSSQATFKSGNPRSQFWSFFGSLLSISLSCTVPGCMQQRCIKTGHDTCYKSPADIILLYRMISTHTEQPGSCVPHLDLPWPPTLTLMFRPFVNGSDKLGWYYTACESVCCTRLLDDSQSGRASSFIPPSCVQQNTRTVCHAAHFTCPESVLCCAKNKRSRIYCC